MLLLHASAPRQKFQAATLVLVLDSGEVPGGVRRPDGSRRQSVDEIVDFLQGVPEYEVLAPDRQELLWPELRHATEGQELSGIGQSHLPVPIVARVACLS